MTLYRNGSLLRDNLGDLWVIMGREPGRPCARYVLVRLADSFTSGAAYRIVHRQMELVSEA